eukprot:7093344-Lingulodinium_polyedra.AAC.1
MPRTMCLRGHDPSARTNHWQRTVSGRSGSVHKGDQAMVEPRGYRGRVPLESGASGMLGPA